MTLPRQAGGRTIGRAPSLFAFRSGRHLTTLACGKPSSRLSVVAMRFQGDFGGSASLVFPPESASKLVSVILGEEVSEGDLDTMRIETLNEVGNIVINGVMGSFSNVLSRELKYSLPNYMEAGPGQIAEAASEDKSLVILLVHTSFDVKELNIKGHIILFFEVSSFDALISAVEGAGPGA